MMNFLEDIEDQIPDFVYGKVFQSIYPYGERSGYPSVSDERMAKQ